jgi:hypothetical protein
MHRKYKYTDFLKKILKYHISWKYVQWEQSCTLRAGGRADMKLLVAFRNFANEPKKETSLFTPWRHMEWVEVRLLSFLGTAVGGGEWSS